MKLPIMYHCKDKDTMTCTRDCHGLYKDLESAVGIFRKEETLLVSTKIFAVFEDASECLVPDCVYLKHEHSELTCITYPKSLAGITGRVGYVCPTNKTLILPPEEVKKNEQAWLEELVKAAKTK